MKKFIHEFREFAIKGSMIDMAVGVVVGTAFNNVINVLVKKVIMPPLSLLTEGVTLSNRKWVLRAAGDAKDEVAIGYGEMLEAFLDFLIMAFAIFIVLKGINRLRDKANDPEDAEVSTPKDIQLLSNIEKLVQEQNQLLRKNDR